MVEIRRWLSRKFKIDPRILNHRYTVLAVWRESYDQYEKLGLIMSARVSKRIYEVLAIGNGTDLKGQFRPKEISRGDTIISGIDFEGSSPYYVANPRWRFLPRSLERLVRIRPVIKRGVKPGTKLPKRAKKTENSGKIPRKGGIQTGCEGAATIC